MPDAHVLTLKEIAPKLVDLLQQDIPEPPGVQWNGDPEKETKIAEFDMWEIENENRPGRPSRFGCPDCGGVLWEIDDESFLRFRCRVGHAFTARYLATAQRQSIETALWSPLRALEESGALYKRIADGSSHRLAAERLTQRADGQLANARILRDFLLEVAGVPSPEEQELGSAG